MSTQGNEKQKQMSPNENNYPSFDQVNQPQTQPSYTQPQYQQGGGGGEQKNLLQEVIDNQKEAFAKNIMDKAQDHLNRNWADKFKCKLGFLQIYFDIETDEVIERLRYSLIPFNSKFISLVGEKPDLYGPFWIYTTLIFFIAASGSMTKYLHGMQNADYFQEFVPVAASVIYGVGFCLPFVVSMLMKFFGSETPFVLVLCIYGYSFTIYIPIVVLCVPFEFLQWFLLFYAVVASTAFLLGNFQEELNKYIENKKYFVLGVILIFQICLFLVLKMNFFAQISKQVQVK